MRVREWEGEKNPINPLLFLTFQFPPEIDGPDSLHENRNVYLKPYIKKYFYTCV